MRETCPRRSPNHSRRRSRFRPYVCRLIRPAAHFPPASAGGPCRLPCRLCSRFFHGVAREAPLGRLHRRRARGHRAKLRNRLPACGCGMRLILVRHPKPLCEKGICYGRLDLGCQPQALLEAVHRLGKLVPAARVFASPAKRARDLAALLSADIVVDDRLQELDFGDWRAALAGSGTRSHRRLACGPAGLRSAEWRDADRDGGAMRFVARKPFAKRQPGPRCHPRRPDPPHHLAPERRTAPCTFRRRHPLCGACRIAADGVRTTAPQRISGSHQ